MPTLPRTVDEFDAIFFISLESACERRESIERQILMHNLKNTVLVDAVDGRKMDCAEARRSGVVKDGDQLGRPLSAGEIGCMLSHRSVWQRIVDSGMETALIFEDDVVLRPNFREYIQTILFQIPPDWDMIYLHSHFRVGSGRGCDSGRRKLSENVYSAFQENGGTAAYAISQRRGVANYLIDRSTPVSYAADGVTNWLSADWDKCAWASYIVSPFVVEPHSFSSSIWESHRDMGRSGFPEFVRTWLMRLQRAMRR